MRRLIIVFLLAFSCLFAKADYSQMSNEELIALIGYVSDANKKEFHKELNKRKQTFSAKEKKRYDEKMQAR